MTGKEEDYGWYQCCFVGCRWTALETVSTLNWSVENTVKVILSNLAEKKKSCTHHDIRQGHHVSPNLLTIWNMIHVIGDTMETARKNNESSDQEICWCVMYDVDPQGIKLYCISKCCNRRWHFFSPECKECTFSCLCKAKKL